MVRAYSLVCLVALVAVVQAASAADTEGNDRGFLRSAFKELEGPTPRLPLAGELFSLLSPAVSDAGRLRAELRDVEELHKLRELALQAKNRSPLARLARILFDEDLGSIQLVSIDPNLATATGDVMWMCKGNQPFCRQIVTSGWKTQRDERRALGGNLLGSDKRGEGRVLLLRTARAAFGWIWTSGKTYLLRPLSKSVFAITTWRSDARVDRDYVARAKGLAPVPGAPRPPLANSAAADNCPDIASLATLDVLVAFTARADAAARKADYEIHGLVDIAVGSANRSFELGDIHGQIRVVSENPATYVETDNLLKDLESLRDGKAGLEQVRDRRKATKADVAVLIVDRSDNTDCGAAYRGPSITDAYAVVNWKCIAGKQSFIHEIGHLIGAAHDRNPNEDPVTPEYAHGHVTSGPTGTATIMAYRDACMPCGRIPMWSNPYKKSFDAQSLGVPGVSYVGCLWRQNLPVVSKFDGG